MIREQHGDLTFVTDGPLGGYYEGGDPNTTYPILWGALIDHWNVRSVIDVGCGDGKGAATWFARQGVETVGIDGLAVDTMEPGLTLIRHDFTEGPFITGEPFDLAWSAEFVEHVDERYVPNFLETFALADTLLMTHALPGQGGHHHVNCQPPDYWVERVAVVGFELDEPLTYRCRELAFQEPIPPDANYFGRTGLAFRKRP